MKTGKSTGIVALALLGSDHVAFAQPTTSYKFDFGSGKVAKGFTGVSSRDVYTEATKFGFDYGTSVQEIDRGGRDALKRDFITSDKPFYFSMKVPAFDPQLPNSFEAFHWPPSLTEIKNKHESIFIKPFS